VSRVRGRGLSHRTSKRESTGADTLPARSVATTFR
jgi:hypothetical protein